MLKAVFRQGSIHLLEPTPPDWKEGQELVVESGIAECDNASPEEIMADFRELNEICAQSDPEQDEIMMRAIAEERAAMKELARRDMGL